jgi:excisionase family DNA binding protein
VEADELITIQDAAERFGVSENNIYSAIYRGRLAFQERFGRKVLRVADVEEYLRTSRRGRPKKAQ